MTQNPDCPDCPELAQAPDCSTTTFAVTAVPCTGTITALAPVENYNYCCNPISICAIEHKICANCPCYKTGVQVSTLPTNGKLLLNNIEVIANQILTDQENGLLIYEKNAGFVGLDNFQFIVKTTCGDSAPITVNVICNNVICEEEAPCSECGQSIVAPTTTTTTTVAPTTTTTTTVSPTTTTTTTV